MAENKRSFLMYVDHKEVFNELSNEDAGQLIKHIFAYVSDEDPETSNLLVKLSFIPIKLQLKRDLIAWENRVGSKKIAGSIGGIKSGEARRKQKEANEANALNALKIEANEAVNDNDNVNVNVNVNEEEKQFFPKSEMPTTAFVSQSTILPLKEIIEFVSSDEEWLRAVKELSRCENPEKRFATFESFLVTENKTEKTITDFKSHFSKWLPFELKREKETLKNATNGTDFKNTTQQLREINKSNPNRHPSASGSETGGY